MAPFVASAIATLSAEEYVPLGYENVGVAAVCGMGMVYSAPATSPTVYPAFLIATALIRSVFETVIGAVYFDDDVVGVVLLLW